MPDTGTVQTKSGDLHEVWGVLPAVAAATQRVGPALAGPASAAFGTDTGSIGRARRLPTDTP